MILLLGFVYFRLSGASGQLASIGFISFAGVVQVLPCLIGGLFWRRANADGAVAGLVSGAALWAYTLFLPSFAGGFVVSQDVIAHGPFGWSLLRPQALFGLEGIDPLVHSLFWSLAVNTSLFVLLSVWRDLRPLERLQGTLFVDVFRTPAEATSGVIRRSATTHDLCLLAQRILGASEALETFREAARAQGVEGNVPIADNAFITQLERRLAGSVGAASAHALISQVVTGETISLDELMRIADETQQVREYSRRLEEKSRELQTTARQLSAGERAADAARRREGRLPLPGEPRGPHADDVDPVVHRDPARGKGARTRPVGALPADHPRGKRAPDAIAGQHARPEPARTR